MRSGARILSLLAIPLNSSILNSLGSGPKRQMELRREAGSPAQSTLRAHLSAMEEIGAIVKRRRNAFPGALEYELTDAGCELLFVVAILERWLTGAPEGPLELGSDPAKAAIKALSDGWSAMVARALASGPRSLTELDRLITAYNYPSLERRLGAMRLAGLVEPAPRNGNGTPYKVTKLLRRGVGPMIAASRWERRHLSDETARIGRIDAEAALMLAVPLLTPPTDLSGICRLAVEVSHGNGSRPVSITVRVKDGRARLTVLGDGDLIDAWATGSAAAWLGATIDGDAAQLEVGGDSKLARALIDTLSKMLFADCKTGKFLNHL